MNLSVARSNGGGFGSAGGADPAVTPSAPEPALLAHGTQAPGQIPKPIRPRFAAQTYADPIRS